jgi:hypothetical protein
MQRYGVLMQEMSSVEPALGLHEVRKRYSVTIYDQGSDTVQDKLRGGKWREGGSGGRVGALCDNP